MEKAEIERRKEESIRLHHAKYNCAQSVACVLCDLVGLDQEQVFCLTEAFGGGMGGFDQTCGAVSGGVLILGFARCEGSQKMCSKQASYALAHDLVERMETGCGFNSASCVDLRPADPTLVLTTCDGWIAKAVEYTIQILAENGLI